MEKLEFYKKAIQFRDEYNEKYGKKYLHIFNQLVSIYFANNEVFPKKLILGTNSKMVDLDNIKIILYRLGFFSSLDDMENYRFEYRSGVGFRSTKWLFLFIIFPLDKNH